MISLFLTIEENNQFVRMEQITEEIQKHQTKMELRDIFNQLQIATSVRPQKLKYYLNIISKFKDILKENFDSDDLVTIFSNRPLVRYLYHLNLIDNDALMDFCQLSKTNYFALYDLIDHQKFDRQKCRIYDEVDINDEGYIPDNHDELCLSGQCPDPVATIIQEDNLDEFQNLLDNNKIKINDKINSSIYDCIFTFEIRHSLIEYAARTGSVNIFKYLWLQNNLKLDYMLGSYATMGGNSEIIHIIHEENPSFIDESSIITAIEFHRNSVFEYFMNSCQPDYIDKIHNKLASVCIKTYNIEAYKMLKASYLDIRHHIDLFISAASVGFYNRVKKFLNYDNFDPNKISSKFGTNALIKAATENQYDIVTTLIESGKVNEMITNIMNQNAFIAAVNRNNYKIIKFLASLPTYQEYIRKDKIFVYDK
ncbi:cortactin-binding protein [Tritrichomonas foetus]|uniref:Cortactin-binding protein n=1 Tax=Tritrichomonas foetus TaxID=1144522 RepID=A0A1J4K9I5_9EUKA|nr:cortactin-binding protein [Tritrichomonas foetus]|eukprot:OHT07568.1 cortactin-binding protein [Tritrichomonas foetus]